MTTQARPEYAGVNSSDRFEATLTAIGEQAFAEEANTDAKPVFGYYRLPNGDITTGLMSDMEELWHRKEGWVPLEQYGRFDMTTEWAANHPFEALFMHGGAIEMTVEQVLEQGFHVHPPEIPGCRRNLDQNHKKHNKTCFNRRYRVNFPQLEGDPRAKAWECDYCGAVRYSKKGLDQHMEAIHKEERGDKRTAESLAAAIVEGLNLARLGSPEDVMQPAGDTGQVSAERALAALGAVGLNKKQREALAKLGINIPADPDEPEDPEDKQEDPTDGED